MERLAALHLAFREMEVTPKWPWGVEMGRDGSEREKPWKNPGEHCKTIKKNGDFQEVHMEHLDFAEFTQTNDDRGRNRDSKGEETADYGRFGDMTWCVHLSPARMRYCWLLTHKNKGLQS